jgi:hypothetical protein
MPCLYLCCALVLLKPKGKENSAAFYVQCYGVFVIANLLYQRPSSHAAAPSLYFCSRDVSISVQLKRRLHDPLNNIIYVCAPCVSLHNDHMGKGLHFKSGPSALYVP